MSLSSPPAAPITFTPDHIAFVASNATEAQAALRRLRHRYGSVPAEEAEVVVALGGDGLMLQTLHRYIDRNVPIYGMNRGSIGFLMNEFAEDNLIERLAAAEQAIIHPLSMTATTASGDEHRARAINEVALLRQSHQAAKLQLSVDGKERLEELICDGVLLSTPAGSTAYNLSANGPIVPLNAPLMALTPISPFRPRRWRGALLPNSASLQITVREPSKRPVSATADHVGVRSVVKVDIRMDMSTRMVMLHDPGHSMDERILREQFGY